MAYQSLIVRAHSLYLGKRNIIREGRRYKIYLPTRLNDVWEELKGKKVKVFLVIDEKDVTA